LSCPVAFVVVLVVIRSGHLPRLRSGEKVQRKVFQCIFVDIVNTARPRAVLADREKLIRDRGIERDERKLVPREPLFCLPFLDRLFVDFPAIFIT
jgi:hypothetical protein